MSYARLDSFPINDTDFVEIDYECKSDIHICRVDILPQDEVGSYGLKIGANDNEVPYGMGTVRFQKSLIWSPPGTPKYRTFLNGTYIQYTGFVEDWYVSATDEPAYLVLSATTRFSAIHYVEFIIYNISFAGIGRNHTLVANTWEGNLTVTSKVINETTDSEYIIKEVGKRTVYTKKEIETMAKEPTKVILFSLNFHFPQLVPLEKLKAERLLFGTPQSITEINHQQYFRIIELSGLKQKYFFNN